MRRPRIGGLGPVTRTRQRALHSRLLNPSLASVMPQAVAVWCAGGGHETALSCFTGAGDPVAGLPTHLDVLFVGAFTRSAQLAYAISALYRRRGAVTILGG